MVVGLIGAAPPICFAIFGLITSLFERRFGLERMVVIVTALIALGLLLMAVPVAARSYRA